MTRAVPALTLAVLTGLAACAPVHAPVPPKAAAAGPPPGRGVIVSVRPIEAAPGSPGAAGGGDMRSAILGAVGRGAVIGVVADAPPSGPATYEFIARLDDGRTASVVQPNTDGLRPGERVVLSEGPRTRLCRVAAPVPGAD